MTANPHKEYVIASPYDVKSYADLQQYMTERGFRVPNRIPLTRGFVARVDSEDYHLLWGMKWTYLAAKNGKGYAIHHYWVEGKAYAILMHRYLMGDPEGKWVDHENGDGLDNRRSNLRICTPSQNARNRKPHGGRKYKGVYGEGNSYTARICVNGESHHLGTFPNELAAAAAYDQAARIHHGSFARFNFPIAMQAL